MRVATVSAQGHKQVADMDKPTQPTEPTAEAKRSRGFAGYVVWGFGIVVVYILSMGPAVVLAESRNHKGPICRILSITHGPLVWAYEKAPLHKPLGIYLHLWLPKRFDKNGDLP